MKHFKRIVVAVSAVILISSCSILQNVASSGRSTGSSTGTALAAIYNIFKATGGIDLSNLTTLINLGKILTGANALTGATQSFTDDFAAGLISGSSNLVNNANVASVLNGLKSLSSIDTSVLSAAAQSAYAGTAVPVSASNAGVSQTLSALNGIFSQLGK